VVVIYPGMVKDSSVAFIQNAVYIFESRPHTNIFDHEELTIPGPLEKRIAKVSHCRPLRSIVKNPGVIIQLVFEIFIGIRTPSPAEGIHDRGGAATESIFLVVVFGHGDERDLSTPLW
jgi:hypothetical protein